MKRNIVLIGMPGSGKTSVGQLLAARLGYGFLDTDAMAEQQAGCSISELFAREGEAHFRDIEAQCALRAASQSRAVIATGGGIVLREANMAALGSSGRIVYLRRSMDDILQADMRARPLLAADPTRLHALFAQRGSLYEAYGDFAIDNDGAIEDTVARIMEVLEAL